MITSPDPLDFSALSAHLEQGARVALFIRHSERPPIRADDRDFGKHLGLTPHGIALAETAGKNFVNTTDTRFLASPMMRCRLTARHFAEGMGISKPQVEDADTLGVKGYFYEDPYAVQEIMRRQGYMAYMLEYLEKGSAPYSCPIDSATEQTLTWLQNQSTAKLNLFVSHDIFVASILTGLKLRAYTQTDWVGFLHGFVLIQHPNSSWHCQPCVPSQAELSSPSPFLH